MLKQGLACSVFSGGVGCSYASQSPVVTSLHIPIPDSKSLLMLSLLSGMAFLVSPTHATTSYSGPTFSQGLLGANMTFTTHSAHLEKLTLLLR